MKLIATVTIALFASFFAAGCTSSKPMTTEQALTPGVEQAIPVPPGARLIAFGHYPLPFVAPRDGGMIYVYDNDTSRVVFVTSYPPTDDGSKTVSGDLSQLSKSSFDPSHSYRVYYFPPQSAPVPTTRAAGT
jgi:hypothetical protein